MLYRGYFIRTNEMPGGWKMTITRNGIFVANGTTHRELHDAVMDARRIVDALIAGKPIDASAVP